MAIQGFDYNYFMSGLLNYVKTNFTGWETKTTADVEKVIANLYPAAADKAAAAQDFYTAYGDTWGLSPNALFNVTEYKLAAALQKTAWAQAQFDAGKFFSLEQAKAAFDTQIAENPYTHYLQVGAALGVNPSNSFDESTFLQNLVTYFKLDMTATDLRTLAIANNITPLAFYVDSVVPVAELAKDITAPPVPTTEQVTPPPPPAPIAFTVAAGAATAAEGANAAFTVTLSEAQAAATTVEYKLAGTGGAVLGTDTATATTTPGESGTLTFAAGETTKVITVPVVFDTTAEPGEGLSVVISNPGTGTVLGTAVTATTEIVNAPTPAFTLTSDAVAGTPTQEGKNITFTITPSGVVAEDTTLLVNLSGSTVGAITAQASASDFTSAQTVTFKAGETAARSTFITVVSDSATEGIEGYKAQLLNSSSAEVASTTGLVNDPSYAYVLTGPASVDEGASATYTVTADRVAPTGGITIPYTLTGNATAGTDFTPAATTGTITIAAGATTGTLILNATADNKTEADAENVIVTLGTPSTGNVTTGTVTTVVNDTSKGLEPGQIALSTSATAVDEGTAFTYTVTLGTAAPTGGLNVPYTLSGTATTGTDYTGSASTTGNIAVAAGATTGTLTLTTVADTTTEGAETVINTITAPNSYTMVSGKNTTTTIINDTSLTVEGKSYTLTSTTDILSGTAGNDTFVGTDSSFTTGDQISGGDGIDTMSIILGAANTAIVTLNSIENVKIQAAAAATGLNASSWGSISSLSFDTSTAAATVSSLSVIPSVTVKNSNGGGLALNINDTVVSGTTDSMSLTLNGAADSTTRTLTIQGATAGGVETWNIVSTGAVNRINLAGVSMKTVNVSGDQALTISGAALPTTVTSFNASSMTAGGVSVDLTGSTLTSVTGGAGNDTFLLSTTAVGTTVIDGGAGTGDILGLNIANVAAALATTTKVTNVETLKIQDAVTLGAATSHNLATITGLQNITFGALLTVDDAATNTFTETISGLVSGSTIRFDASTVNTATGATPTNNASIVATVTNAATGSNDILNIVMAKGAAVAAAEEFIGMTANNVESFVFDVKSLTGATTTITGLDDPQLSSLTFKSSALTSTGVATAAANLLTGSGFTSTVVNTIDLSGYTAAATGTVNIATLSSSLISTGATIKGPAGGILIATGGAGSDTISTGVHGSNSSTGITGGAGADNINLSASAATADILTVGATDSTTSIYDSITGFVNSATVGDKIDFNGAGAVLGNVAAGTATGVTNLTGAVTNGIMTFSGTATASLSNYISAATNANFANSAANKIVAFVYSGDTYVIDSGASTATTDDMMVRLVGVADATIVSTAAAASTIFVA